MREPSLLQPTAQHRKRSTQSDTALLPSNVFFQRTLSPLSVSPKTGSRTGRHRGSKVRCFYLLCVVWSHHSLLQIGKLGFLSPFSRMKTLTGLWTRPLTSPAVWRGPQTGWLRDCQRTWPRRSTAGNSTACSHKGAGNTTHYKMQHTDEFSLPVESIFDLVWKRIFEKIVY